MNTPKIRFKGFKDDWEQRKFEAVGTADEEQNKSKKNVARRCDRGGVGVLRGNRCTAYRGDCSFYHTEYTGDRHGASERGQEYHGLVG